MMKCQRFFWALAVCALGWGQGVAEDQPKADPQALAAQAKEILTRSCARCHNGEGSTSGYPFDVAKHGDLVKSLEGDPPMIVGKKLDQSPLWDAISKGRMPQRNSPEQANFTKADQQIIQQWILAGAPAFAEVEKRPFVSLKTVLKAIKDDLDNADLRDRPYLRYFTLTHLHNNPTMPGSHLHQVRAALAKLVNSLTWADQIIPIRSVDGKSTHYTVYSVDMRTLRWKREIWEDLLKLYPYGLSYDNQDDEDLKKYHTDILRLNDNQSRLPYVRADWYISTAARPTFYHQLLYDDFLPELVKRNADAKNPANPKQMTGKDLEDHLRVSVVQNILGKDVKAMRAAFAKSGVSGNNRLIERHPIDGRRYYWKSYDFIGTTWEANLQQFPLGPTFAQKALYGDVAKRFPDTFVESKAFVHDGGEIIFSLPNGMQAYLLVDGNDNRINAGPIEVVSDALKTSGTPLIVNGLSCFACHKDGMIPSPPDMVRDGAAVFGNLRDRVKLLYPGDEVIKTQLTRDSKLYLSAQDEAVLPILKEAGFPVEQWKKANEPIGEVARQYQLVDLDLTTAAAELYLEDPTELANRIKGNSDMIRIGLGALTQPKGLIKRGAWESKRGSSQYQQTAREFGYTPNN